jgi:xanthine dehydrogenase accessory factor
LEGDLLKKAWWRTKDGPTVLTYDSTDSTEDNTPEDEEIAWGFGLGCNGVVEVLLERVTPESRPYLEALAADEPAVLATVIRGTKNIPVGTREFPQSLAMHMTVDATSTLQNARSSWQTYTDTEKSESLDVYFEYLAPAQRLVIFGAGHDVPPIVHLAKNLLGWHVTVVETRSAQPHPERFPEADSVIALRLATTFSLPLLTQQTAVLLMTHHYPDDEKLLGPLLQSPACYIGVLGPKRRTERILQGLQNPDTSRLYAPLGLDIGADNPEEIALSVLAEIKAVLSDRKGGLLRDRNAPIHLQNAANMPNSFTNAPKEPIACALASD